MSGNIMAGMVLRCLHKRNKRSRLQLRPFIVIIDAKERYRYFSGFIFLHYCDKLLIETIRLEARNMGKNSGWYHRALFISALIILLCVTVYVAMAYGKINTPIPTHFNSSGQADSYGGKSSLIFQLGIAWGLYIVLSVVGHFPSLWNTGKAIGTENKEKSEQISRTMLSALVFALSSFFSYSILCAAKNTGLHPVALPLFIAAVFGIITVSLVRLVKNG